MKNNFFTSNSSPKKTKITPTKTFTQKYFYCIVWISLMIFCSILFVNKNKIILQMNTKIQFTGAFWWEISCSSDHPNAGFFKQLTRLSYNIETIRTQTIVHKVELNDGGQKFLTSSSFIQILLNFSYSFATIQFPLVNYKRKTRKIIVLSLLHVASLKSWLRE